MFEEVRSERLLLISLSLTILDLSKQSNFADIETNEMKDLASGKKTENIERICCCTFIKKLFSVQ